MIQAVYQNLISLVFPLPCELCGKLTEHSRAQGICSLCREALFSSVPDLAEDTSRYPRVIDRIFAAHPYDGPVKTLLCQYKFEQKRYLGALLSELSVTYFKRLPEKPTWDALVPVPMPLALKLDRGFNQSEALAVAVGRHLGICVTERALQVAKKMRTQSRLDKVERQANVRDAFRADRRLVTGKRLLLVDDILTTGFTAGSCAEALKSAGAASVDLFVVARGL